MAKVRLQEFRQLLLPIETVVDAVLELDRSHGGTLAIGKLMEARVEIDILELKDLLWVGGLIGHAGLLISVSA